MYKDTKSLTSEKSRAYKAKKANISDMCRYKKCLGCCGRCMGSNPSCPGVMRGCDS